MKMSLYVVAVAEEDDNDSWNALPEELAVALRSFCEDTCEIKEFAVVQIFWKDEPHTDVQDPLDEDEVKSWKHNGLGACIDMITDYQEGVIR